jgi:peptidoglycan/xylan/chitin deacetylase (PgdA/CDA1 family)
MTENQPSLKKLKFKLTFNLFISIVLLLGSLSTFIYGYQLTQKPVLVVLLFHEALKKPQNPWEITDNTLEKYIEKFLSLKYKPVDPENFENMLSQGFKGRNFLVTFDDGTESEYRSIENLYKKYKIKSVLFIVDELVDLAPNLTTEQIKKLQKDYGTHIGLHGKYHERYTEQIKSRDLGGITEETRQKFNSKLGCNIKWLAYPYGDYNKTVIEDLKNKTAIDLAFTIESGLIDKDTDKFTLNRYMYMGGLEPNGEDENFNLNLFPPESYLNGQLLITLSTMVFFFSISRVLMTWKYYKALAVLRMKIENKRLKSEN